jgi:16S rRNA processing protein RimM
VVLVLTQENTQLVPSGSWPSDAVEVGQVLGPWGVKGWLKIHPFTDHPQALLDVSEWHTRWPSSQARAALVAKQPLSGAASSAPAPILQIDQSKVHGQFIVAQIRGVNDRLQAQALRGLRIFIGREHFPAIELGEYYWVDLIGLNVVNRQAQALGVVMGLLDTGPHSVLRLSPPSAPAAAAAIATEPQEPLQERLIPFVSAYVDDVNLVERQITVDWGLDY